MAFKIQRAFDPTYRSPFKGVQQVTSGKWRARTHNGVETVYLGTYDTEDEAAKVVADADVARDTIKRRIGLATDAERALMLEEAYRMRAARERIATRVPGIEPVIGIDILCREDGKYVTKIGIGVRDIKLGTFDSRADAHEAWMQAKAAWQSGHVVDDISPGEFGYEQ